MTALVARFAMTRRADPNAGHEALRLSILDQKIVRRLPRRSNGSQQRWTGASDIVEAPARFAA